MKKTIIPLVAVGILTLVVYWVIKSQTEAVGPEEVILDKHVCHFCGMHIGDARFAGQVQTEHDTYFYDDPGCLINDLENLEHPVVAVYYRHFFEERWIPEDQVVFFDTSESPMGYNLAAISKDDPESVVPIEKRIELSQAEALMINTLKNRKKMGVDNHSDKMEMKNRSDQNLDHAHE